MKKRLLAAACGVLALSGIAWAYTVTSSQVTLADGRRVYRYDVTVQQGDNPLRDFHIVRRVTRERLVGTMNLPTVTSTNPPQNRTGWTMSPSPDGVLPRTADSATWRTTDEQGGEQGDTNQTDDPIPVGATVRFEITTPLGRRWRNSSVNTFPTSDGSTTPPGGTPPGGFEDLPGPVTASVVIPSDPTPPPGSTTPVTLEGCVPSQSWEIYTAKSLSTSQSTDPLGIGINTNDPIPPSWGVSFSASTGSMSNPDLDTYPASSTNMSVGSGCPAGSTFYVVLVCRDPGSSENHTWSEPMEFVATP